MFILVRKINQSYTDFLKIINISGYRTNNLYGQIIKEFTSKFEISGNFDINNKLYTFHIDYQFNSGTYVNKR